MVCSSFRLLQPLTAEVCRLMIGNTQVCQYLASDKSFLAWTIAACFAGISPSFKIAFYAGRYDDLLLGIVPVGNPMDCIPRAAVDVVVLEEPEHLSWFHCGPQWTSTFKHVVSTAC